MTKWKISMTATNAMGKRKILQRMRLENDKRKITIKNLKEILAYDQNKILEIIHQKNLIIQEYRQTIDGLELENNKDINREM